MSGIDRRKKHTTTQNTETYDDIWSYRIKTISELLLQDRQQKLSTMRYNNKGHIMLHEGQTVVTDLQVHSIKKYLTRYPETETKMENQRKTLNKETIDYYEHRRYQIKRLREVLLQDEDDMDLYLC